MLFQIALVGEVHQVFIVYEHHKRGRLYALLGRVINLQPSAGGCRRLERRLRVMDAAAFAMLTEQAIPMVRVFGLAEPENILKVIAGDPRGTVLHP